MNMISWFSNQQHSPAMVRRMSGIVGVAILLLMTGAAVAQNPAAPDATPGAQMSIPQGYTVHESIDLGGNMDDVVGSGSMYDTMANSHTGPRVQSEIFELHALPTTKNTWVDELRAVGSGFGGDPNNFVKFDFSKGKFYEFTSTFRRDRQYFDYDLLGNPNINTGVSIPVSGSATPFAWPQVQNSPEMFNTVRHMTDTSLTIFPESKLTFRIGLSHGIFQGPSLSPGESVGKYNSLLSEYQRNGTDNLLLEADWKPVQGTQLTYAQEFNRYKEDSYFTIAPSEYMFQEANGTPVSVGDWDAQTAYSTSACNSADMGGGALLTAPVNGGAPILNAACDAVTSYLRSQPTRIMTPTESVRFQSTSIKHIAMNGNFRYTDAHMTLPNYYENFRGLDALIRSITYTGNATGRREVVAGDYGVVWQVAPAFSLSEQIDYSNVEQPGSSNISAGVTESENTTTATGYGTINYVGGLTAGTTTVEGSANGTPLPEYFGQKIFTNNVTGTLDLGARTTLSLDYRYRSHVIAEGPGNPGNIPIPAGADTGGTVTINENAVIFTAAVRPMNNWDVNGSVEVSYDDNAFTPVAPRQLRHYRVHTLYRAKPWATFSGAFNDLERHNNTDNNQATVALSAASGGVPFEGPLDHVDHSRVASFGIDVNPNEHYGFDLNYAYSDVYTATNICYLNGATATLPGAATAPGAVPTGLANVAANGTCGTYPRGATTNTVTYTDWYGRDFTDAPTQALSAALVLSPSTKVRMNYGYRINDANGTRFFNDARDVNGSLVSEYQSPFVNVAWIVKPGWTWKAEYRYLNYAEGGPSGAAYCSTSTSATATVSPCTLSTYAVGVNEPSSGLTAPRNFHANNITLGVHYEF